MSVELWPDAAVKTSDIQCGKACGFSGGYSGFCSSCWKTLTPAEKESATATAKEEQPGRTQLRELRIEEGKRVEHQKRVRLVEEQDKKVDNLKKFKEARSTCNLVAQSLEFGDSSRCEIWDCGLGGQHRAVGEPLTSEPEHEHDEAHLKALRGFSSSLSEALRGIEEGSSESGSEYIGFFVNVAENPRYSAQSSAEEIITQSVAENDEFGPLEFDHNLDLEPRELFSRYSELVEEDDDDASISGIQKAMKIIQMACVEGSGFVSSPASDGDCWVGNIFLGGRTSRGDLVGATVQIVWT